MANEYPEALKRAYNGGLHDRRLLDDHSRTEFWDRITQKLHSIDPGYRYCLAGNNVYYADFIHYCPPQFRSSNCNPTGIREEQTSVDVIASNSSGAFVWPGGRPSTPESRHKADPSQPRKGRCHFPRPGAPDYGYGSGGAVVSGSENSVAASASPTEGACGTDRPAPHWKTLGGKCLPSCGYAGSLYCKSNDCAGLSLSRRCGQGDVASGSSPASAPADCGTLRTQIPELQRRLDEQMKAYRGKRQKKWLGLKRNSCKNVRLCETLASTIHLAQENPSIASRLSHYKKQFGKNCKDFERCRAIAAEIEQIRKDLNGSIQIYNKNCRN